MFEEPGKDFGMDLLALNVQRGRDHGLRPYNEYRTLCGLPRASSFEDLVDTMSRESIERLKNTYENVQDIDLFVGGVNEKAVPGKYCREIRNFGTFSLFCLSGSMLGPVFLCIVGDQFSRLKHGDRFFYDIGNQPHSFTPFQLNEIRKESLARIICSNSQIAKIQPLVFLQKSTL